MIAAGRCAAIVTAAGASSRMGRCKALVRWRGRPLVAHQCRALADLARVVVVLGARAETIRREGRIPADVAVVTHHGWRDGRSSSIEAGAEAAGPGWDAYLLVAVDQPIDPAVVATLLGAFDPATHAVAVPTWAGRAGHPVLLAGRLHAELLALSRHPEGLRTLVHAHRDATARVAVDTPAVRWDLNTPSDHAAARAVDDGRQ